MNPNFLDFEQPIADLQAKIEELRLVGNDNSLNIGDEISRLQDKSKTLTEDIFGKLTSWQIARLARHPKRPYTLDYIEHIFTEFDELHGDRHFSDDAAIVGGIARLDNQPVMIIGHQKGREVREKVRRNFGMPRPEGYRKACRLMEMAERFKMPILTFIDTPGAYPGIDAEERNQSEAIAWNLRVMARLKTPIIATVIGEGGSGGALAIGVCDQLNMLQYSTYAVISPEGCASILWKTAEKAPDAAEGYTLGGADMLRRAMGKKKPEEMAKQRGGFIDGCKTNNIDADLAGNIFDLVEKFAGYGFNKSHSAAYGLVSYQTAWLKTHYPAPFMAAVLSADMHNTDKVVTLIEEIRTMKLRLDAPDVNTSEFKFTVNDEGRIIYGLGAIKGVGEGPVEAITEARQDGPFKDLFDFCARVDLKRINKRTLDGLIRSGALDRLGPYFHDEQKAYQANIDRNRAVLLTAMEEAIKAAEQTARTHDSGHADLFGGLFVEEDADVYGNHRKAKELTLKERLKGEKDTLGLYLTGHPIDEYEGEIRRFARQRIIDLKPARDTQTVAGMIIALRVMKNKKGDKMGFITLDDRSGRIEASLFADAFHSAQSLLQTDAMVVVEGEVSNDDFSGGLRLRVKRVMSMEDARTNLAESLRLKLHAKDLKGDQLRWLGDLLKRHRGACPITMDYTSPDAKAMLQFGEGWRIDPADALIQALRDQFGRDNVFLQYR